MSLVGVVLAFLKANEGMHRQEVLLEAFGVVTIVCSWLLVHTVFALRYAHVYYTEPRRRDRLQDEGRTSGPTTSTSRTPPSRSA